MKKARMKWRIAWHYQTPSGHYTGGKVTQRRIRGCTWYYPVAWTSDGGPPLRCKTPDSSGCFSAPGRCRSLAKAKRWVERALRKLEKERS